MAEHHEQDSVDELFAELETLREKTSQAIADLSATVKAARDDPNLEDIVRARALEADGLRKKAKEIADEIQRRLRIPDEVMETLSNVGIPELDERYSRRDVIETPPTSYFDDILANGLDSLLSTVDPGWLRMEAEKEYRLGSDYLTSPMLLVGTHRIVQPREQPQRFAHALLLCQDHLRKQNDLDFWSLPMAAAEVASLGTRLARLPELGRAAEQKFGNFCSMHDEEQSSAVYELLVGLACLDRGTSVEMLELTSEGKTPEYRVKEFDVPTVIECKRRRLPGYLVAEGMHASRLYHSMHPEMIAMGAHMSIEVEFTADIESVSEADFAETVKLLLHDARGAAEADTVWGSIVMRELQEKPSSPTTRLYAPSFLEHVYGWSVDSGEWDGMICTADPPSDIIVDQARNPNCLKWRCCSPNAEQKRNRGVAGLLGDAMKQVPDGEMGIIYVAYEEMAREDVANARTERIIKEAQQWSHDWEINIPLFIVNRLYPRPQDVGQPDFIESAIPFLAGHADKVFLAWFPTWIFMLDKS